MSTAVTIILSVITALVVHRWAGVRCKENYVKIAGALIIIAYHAAWPILDNWVFGDAFRYIVLGGGYHALIWRAAYESASTRRVLGSSILRWRTIRVFSTVSQQALKEEYLRHLRDHGVEAKVLTGWFDDKVIVRRDDERALEVDRAFRSRHGA